MYTPTHFQDVWWDVAGGARGFEAGTALGLADEMLTLVQKLHEKGFIHRDIKPDNL